MKHDAWEREFADFCDAQDAGFYGYHEKVKTFIRDNFIPKAEVEKVLGEELEFQKAVMEGVAQTSEDIVEDIDVMPEAKNDGRLLGIRAIASEQPVRLRNLIKRLNDVRRALSK